MEGLTPRSRTSRFHRLIVAAASACLGTSAYAAPAAQADKPQAKATTPAAAPAAAAGEVKLDVLQSGAAQKIGGYNPQQAKLAKNKPAAVKKAPEMAAPLYGQIAFGGKQYVVALDEPEGGDAKLYVDANANGDLTDDPAATWEKKQGQGPNGVQLTQYCGSFQLPLGAAKPAGAAAGDADKAAGADAAAAGELVTLSV